MLAEVPTSNVQELQQDVIELLGEISDLMNRASTALSSDRVDNKYADFEKQIRNETSLVENLELRMAIVAPMKAGKSTIVNAVAGQDILPSRNSAMTTLPTEIIFDAGLNEPILTLSNSVLSVFQKTLVSLKEKINEQGLETFTSLSEAEDFVEEAIASAKFNVIEPLLENIRLNFQKEIEYARCKLTDSLEDETQPIIERAQKRLNESFNISLSLPKLKFDSLTFTNPQANINYETRLIDQGYETKEVKKRSFSHWFWIVPKKETIRVKRPDKEERYYTVLLQ